MQNVLKIISVAFIVFVGTSIASNHVMRGGKKLGNTLTSIVRLTGELPLNLARALDITQSKPLRHEPFPKGEEITKLDYNLYCVHAAYEANPKFRLTNLKDNSVVYEWDVEIPEKVMIQSRMQLRNPVLLSGKHLIYSADERRFICRIDSLSKPVWMNHDFYYHHSIELDAENNVWVCATKPGAPDEWENENPSKRVLIEETNQYCNFKDNHVVQLNGKTGEVMFQKSVFEIFRENNILDLIKLKAWNNFDIFHINDVEPAFKTGERIQKGDVFLSFRHISLVLQYRPKTNKVIRVIDKRLRAQHDVDIINDSTITVVNNNLFSANVDHVEQSGKADFPLSGNEAVSFGGISEVLLLNLDNELVESLYLQEFIDNSIYTKTQGLSYLLSNGDLVFEEQNSNILWVISKDGVKLKTTFRNHEYEGLVNYISWSRIYENINF